MSVYQGIEPVIDALLAKLQAELPGAITQQNVDRNDAYVLDQPPAGNVVDFIPPLDQIQSFPFFGFLHGHGALEDDTGSSATGLYDIASVVYAQHAEQQGLAKQVRRYLRCMTRSILEGSTPRKAPPTVWGIVLQEVHYGPALSTEFLKMSDPPSGWITYAYVTFRCKAEEE